jgi:serine/tyrosine/threonine adenylyltransferase
VALWNLLQLANAILPLVGDSKPLEESLQNYSVRFERSWQQMMAQKLGLDHHNETTDNDLIVDLLDFFTTIETDMTLFFRRLADVSTETTIENIPQPLVESFYVADQVQGSARENLLRWLNAYFARVRQTPVPDSTRRTRMNAVNPIYVLRNYLAQQAIDQADQGDPAMIRELLAVLRHPYDEIAGNERFAAKRPEWARHRAGCSMLSCSS